jgi:hypothetical protein
MTQPRLAIVASYPHAQHVAPDLGEEINVDSISSHPAARGAFGDIWRARHIDGRELAIKTLRFYGSMAARGRHHLEKARGANKHIFTVAHIGLSTVLSQGTLGLVQT